MSDMIELCKTIASEAHLGQFRRDGITPYIEHPKRVAKIVEDSGGRESEICAAWLHDVCEDCEGYNTQVLMGMGVSVEITNYLWDLDKNNHSSYEDYIRGILSEEESMRVKIADMISNLTDNPSANQVLKYTKAIMTFSNIQ